MSQNEQAATTTREQADIFRQQIAGQIKQRLAQKQITVTDARDGLKDCFVSTYLGGVAQGLEHFELRGPVEQIARVTEALFRRRLSERGSSYEQPSIDALEGILKGLNQELHIDGLPTELKGVHEQVCSLLLAKAAGDLPHKGNRSVVADPKSSQEPATPEPADLVGQKLRDAIAAYLDGFRAAAIDPAVAPENLLSQLGKLSRLIETLQDVSEADSG